MLLFWFLGPTIVAEEGVLTAQVNGQSNTAAKSHFWLRLAPFGAFWHGNVKNKPGGTFRYLCHILAISGFTQKSLKLKMCGMQCDL
jgi:hypothetical protein